MMGAKFHAKQAMIESLLVWIRFQILPVEYYMIKWLERGGNRIGRTIKIDKATTVASREKFAKVCVEVDLTKH